MACRPELAFLKRTPSPISQTDDGDNRSYFPGDGLGSTEALADALAPIRSAGGSTITRLARPVGCLAWLTAFPKNAIIAFGELGPY